MSRLVEKMLAHPLTRGVDLDDPRTTELRRRIIKEKRFLRRVYTEWYLFIESSLPKIAGDVLELGSGAGFLREVIPGLIASEYFFCSGVKAVLDGRQLPFKKASLRAIVMTNVFHHLPEARRFLRESERCLKPGGAVIMVEPWVTGWSRLVYTKLHHEPFDPMAAGWEFPSSGPLSGANGALPWIIFERDRRTFEAEFPSLRISRIEPFMPLLYLFSGGLSTRSLVPAWSFPALKRFEALFAPWNQSTGMFAKLVVGKTG